MGKETEGEKRKRKDIYRMGCYVLITVLRTAGIAMRLRKESDTMGKTSKG